MEVRNADGSLAGTCDDLTPAQEIHEFGTPCRSASWLHVPVPNRDPADGSYHSARFALVQALIWNDTDRVWLLVTSVRLDAGQDPTPLPGWRAA